MQTEDRSKFKSHSLFSRICNTEVC